MSEENKSWQTICPSTELKEPLGVRALLDNEQVAIFKIKSELYAVSAIDPFTNAAVLARGIVGDLGGKTVVASPIYKQHFCLSSGACLEDEGVSLKTYAVRDNSGQIELAQH